MNVDDIGGDDMNDDDLFEDQCGNIAQYFVGVGKGGAHCIASVEGGYGYYIADRRNAEKARTARLLCRDAKRGGPQKTPGKKDCRCNRGFDHLGHAPKYHRKHHPPDSVEVWCSRGRRYALELWAVHRGERERTLARRGPAWSGEPLPPFPDPLVLAAETVDWLQNLDDPALHGGMVLDDDTGDTVQQQVEHFVRSRLADPEHAETTDRAITWLRTVTWADRVLAMMQQYPDRILWEVLTLLDMEDATRPPGWDWPRIPPMDHAVTRAREERQGANLPLADLPHHQQQQQTPSRLIISFTDWCFVYLMFLVFFSFFFSPMS